MTWVRAVCCSLLAAFATNDTDTLMGRVTLDAVLDHQKSLQILAADAGGTRALGTPGYTASVGYVRNQLLAVGYDVLDQSFVYEGSATTTLLAETRTGDPNHVVLVGAHLDSVAAGHGINDNGSGVAAVLEVARQLVGLSPAYKVRFAFWAAEEQGLIGSRVYVNNLATTDRQRLVAYLNFDMIGSPNAGAFVLDGPMVVRSVFERFYAERGIATKVTTLVARMDVAPFMDAGIPSGGIFSGASDLKTQAEVDLWGGVAGQPFDACYHEACDHFGNYSARALDINSDAVAYAVMAFANP